MGGSSFKDVVNDLKAVASQERAKNLSRFFKTGKGEYGEGDKFIGVAVPDIRRIAREHIGLCIADIEMLVHSQVHEERMASLIIMTFRYKKEKKLFYKLYLKNRKHINNWDLVDVTCPRIIGDYLLDKPRDVLYKLAKSKNLWEKRMAIIATLTFIKNGDFAYTLKIAEILLHDKHDLIHKAVGWMLREIGKKNVGVEKKFLNEYYKVMPRTMLRYAIEKLPEKERKKYLAKRNSNLKKIKNSGKIK